MRKRFIRNGLSCSFTIVLLLSLSACGFNLRGSEGIPSIVSTIQVQSRNPDNDITRLIQRTLQINGVEISSDSDVSLLLDTPKFEERTLSLNANARAGEYQLELSLKVQLMNGEDILLGPETLSVQRFYLTDPDVIVAKADEQELLREEMRAELAQQLLRRLRAL